MVGWTNDETEKLFVLWRCRNFTSLDAILEKRPGLTREFAAPIVNEVIDYGNEHGVSMQVAAEQLYIRRSEEINEREAENDIDYMFGRELHDTAVKAFQRFLPDVIERKHGDIAIILLNQQYGLEELRDLSTDKVWRAITVKFGTDPIEAFLSALAKALLKSPIFDAVEVQAMAAPIGVAIYRVISKVTGNVIRQTAEVRAKPHNCGLIEDDDLDAFFAQALDCAQRAVQFHTARGEDVIFLPFRFNFHIGRLHEELDYEPEFEAAKKVNADFVAGKLTPEEREKLIEEAKAPRRAHEARLINEGKFTLAGSIRYDIFTGEKLSEVEA